MRQVELLNKSKINVSNELNRSKEDNEELKFQVSTYAVIHTAMSALRGALESNLVLFSLIK